jgi:hypothetical protein
MIGGGVANQNFTNYIWTEGDRLAAIIENEHTLHHYIYDAAGERTLKASDNVTNITQNGNPAGQLETNMNNYTLYPSPFVVMDGNGYYTKHYFAGSERIASRPAGLYTAGATPQPLVKPVEGSTKQLDETAQNQLLRLNQYLKEYKMPEAKFKKASKAEKEKQHLYNILEFEVNNLPNGENKQQALILLAKGDLEILKTLLKVEPTATKKGKHGIDIYFFHPDHLGTATFVSDANGKPFVFRLFKAVA